MPGTRGPGRPRSERARQAVLDATLALAAELGPAGLSMEAIARRSGVSKETLYRWWRSKTEVVLDALAEQAQATIPLPDTGTLHGDLQAFLRSSVDSADHAVRAPMLRAVAAAAAGDEEVATTVRERFIASRRANLTAVLERGVARGELDQQRLPILLDLIYGSLWYRVIFGIGALDYEWADSVADTLSRGPTSRP